MDKGTDAILKVVIKWAKNKEKMMASILRQNGKGGSRIIKKLGLRILTYDNKIEVTTKLPDYAIYVDQGRKPGKMPPLRAVLAWMKRKNIDKKYSFVIRRKIGREGIKATNFIKAGFLKTSPDFVQLIKELQKKYAEYIAKSAKDIIISGLNK
jgi:hypothetical protein